ncbi:autotransporter outer membrane beta-barrel domain-containing protein [Aquitalea magnusonii]|uniref:autotransporter outer membrane beta-barrel domain-containing protein n=1 Tax=Aquitalea magnusonii TaxID=332411 RepID=UPI00142D2E3C|nr:autotransporter outer membrane beta-barrel domain-containing protein [Aquitalea magnusonii]
MYYDTGSIITTCVTPGSCSTGDSQSWYYAYVVSSSPSTNLTSSAQSQHNNPGINAARVLDANSALQSRFSGLSTAQQQSSAVSQTLPVLTGAASQAVQAASTAVNQVIVGRLNTQRGQSSGDTFYTDKNVWLKPFGSRADQADTDGVSGYKANIFGLAGGVDGKLNSKLRLGAAFSYARSDVDSNASAPQSLNVDSYQLIGYGSYDLNERTALDFQADIGQNKNESSRTLSFASNVAKANYDSWTVHTGLSLSRSYALSENNSLIPSVRVDYTRIRADGYQESGAGSLNLNVGTQNTEALVFGVDGKLVSKLNDKLTLSTSIGVGYDAMSKQNAITSAYAGAPTAAFTTTGINPSPWLGRGALGLAYKTKNGLEITGRYDLEYRQSYLGQTVSLNLNMPF